MAARLARAACLLLVAAAADECHTPSTNTYTMDPPAATYPARPLRELTTPVTAIIRASGDDRRIPRARNRANHTHVDARCPCHLRARRPAILAYIFI